MTCVAYCDGVLAADKQTTWNGLPHITTKIRRMRDGSIAGAAGNSGICRALMDWYDGDRLASTYPDAKNECYFLVIRPNREIHMFEGIAVPIVLEDYYVAIGSGREYAVAAMFLGCDAKKAVEVACAHDISCGMGIDVLELEQ